MEHKIIIEINVKTDFLEENKSKVGNLKINPEIINFILKNFKSEFTKENKN